MEMWPVCVCAHACVCECVCMCRCVSTDLKGSRQMKAVRISELWIIGGFVPKGEPDMYVTFLDGPQQHPKRKRITGPLLSPRAQERPLWLSN